MRRATAAAAAASAAGSRWRAGRARAFRTGSRRGRECRGTVAISAAVHRVHRHATRAEEREEIAERHSDAPAPARLPSSRRSERRSIESATPACWMRRSRSPDRVAPPSAIMIGDAAQDRRIGRGGRYRCPGVRDVHRTARRRATRATKKARHSSRTTWPHAFGPARSSSATRKLGRMTARSAVRSVGGRSRARVLRSPERCPQRPRSAESADVRAR